MKIEIHILQNFTASCLNRDDTNAPKDCTFGGVRRARISSQCIKRAVRWSDEFRGRIGAELGKRSERYVPELGALLRERGVGPDRSEQEAMDRLTAAFGVKYEKGDRTKYLLYLGTKELLALADLTPEEISKRRDEAKKGKRRFELAPLQPDQALFGRMIADAPIGNIEAACQVAHAISTHQVEMEEDYYTAVDDLQPEQEPGAGMVGTVGFNASCFYRYALVDREQLEKNLGGNKALAAKTILAFTDGFTRAIPAAKQNSMAAQNPPDFVMAVARSSGTPVSLANAFADPIPLSYEGGLVARSVERLQGYWLKMTQAYGTDGITAMPALWTTDGKLEAFEPQHVKSLAELFDQVSKVLV
jgi:CRISPR system Cascade subunit CasC